MYIPMTERWLSDDLDSGFNQPLFITSGLLNEPQSTPINHFKRIHQSGFHSGDHILVIGGSNLILLQKMAMVVGYRGKLTVLENMLPCKEALQQAADVGLFKAFKPLADGDPAWDFRTDKEKYLPIDFEIVSSPFYDLPFAENQFDGVWIEQSLEGLTRQQKQSFVLELHRFIQK